MLLWNCPVMDLYKLWTSVRSCSRFPSFLPWWVKNHCCFSMCSLLIWQQILILVEAETAKHSLSLLLLHREDVHGLLIFPALSVLCLKRPGLWFLMEKFLALVDLVHKTGWRCFGKWLRGCFWSVLGAPQASCSSGWTLAGLCLQHELKVPRCSWPRIAAVGCRSGQQHPGSSSLLNSQK